MLKRIPHIVPYCHIMCAHHTKTNTMNSEESDRKKRWKIGGERTAIRERTQERKIIMAKATCEKPHTEVATNYE